MSNRKPQTPLDGGASVSTAVLEGCTVKVKDSILPHFKSEWRKKLCHRIGTVERIFVPLGGNKPRARVIWHKRSNRGKEFSEVMEVRDLEVLPSNIEGNRPPRDGG